MKLLPMILTAGFISCSAANAVTTLGGVVTINMAGIFQKHVTSPFASVECAAFVQLVPKTLNAALSLGSILNTTSGQNASARGVIATGGATFACTATVPYRWENVDPTIMQMVIFYTVDATDPSGATNPGKKRQLVEVIPIPAAGTVTTLNVSPKL